MKKILSAITACVILMTLPVGFAEPMMPLAVTENAAVTPSDVVDAAEEIELTQAERFGLPTEKIGQRTLSGREFMEMADALVAFAAPDKLSAWKNEFAVLHEIDEPIYRADAMVVLYYAGLTVGGKYGGVASDHGNENAVNRTDIYTHSPDDYCHYDWLDGYAVTHGPEGDDWEVGNAADYNLNHWSQISGRCPFYHNPDTNSFDFDVLPSYADGVLAIIRLIGSENPELFDDLFPKNVRDPAAFTDEVNEKMALYPEVTVDTMPQWTGHILYTEGTFYSDMVQYIQDLKDWGFNAVRVRIDLTRAMDENVEHLNNNLYLLVLDQMIAEAIKQGIHFELTCNYSPGRWFKTMSSGNYMTSVIYDHLYGDKYYQDLTDELWRTITERYKGIPNACLTILPLQEMYYNEHGNFATEENTDWIEYTPQDVANYQAHLIDVIHEVDPDRIVLFEADNRDYYFDVYGQPVIDAIKGKPNTAIALNFPGAGGWLYVGMNFDKPDIDNYHHSMPVVRYPYCGYEAHELITHDCPIKIGGFLPADTEITLNLRKFEMEDYDFMPDGATLRILADGEVLYSEKLTPTEYSTGEMISAHMPYAESEKQITVTLPKETDSVIMDFGSDVDYNVDGYTIWDSMIRLYWSGIKVHLPEKYAVEQLWNATEYDISLGIADVDEPGIYVKRTSDVLIGPLMGIYAENFGTHDITIYDNVTYSTPYKIEETSRETNTEFINILTDRCEGFGYRSFRWESPFGYDGKMWEDVKNYTIDTLDAMTANGLSWWSNDGFYGNYANTHVYGIESTSNGRFPVFYPELFEVLQRYMAPGWCEFSAKADGKGSVIGSQMIIAGGSATLTAVPEDGAEFFGWYLDGELVSTEPSYTATVTSDIKLVAKFTPNAVPGDVNNDGNVTLEDAVQTLKRAMNVDVGNATFIEEAADVVADGKISLEDAIEILKMAMNVAK